MKASFNGARINLVRAFNDLAKTELDDEQKDAMGELHFAVVSLLCMYDDNVHGDCDMLADKVAISENWRKAPVD